MILLAGLLFWGLALTLLARILAPYTRSLRRGALAGWAAMVLAGAAVLLRPHEDILGGEDPGAYLNAAMSFHRQGSLFHADPLLAQVPPAERSSFYYGHAGFGRTKDACLWIHEPDGLIGPWFQPSYSVMAGLLSWFAPRGALYCAPLLGLLTALVLAVLAVRLTGRPIAAPLAFAVYCLSPVVVWNARAPRAEMAAAFFLHGAWALLLAIREEDRKSAWLNTGLALLSLSIVPLFHITASYAVIATYAALLLMALRGRRECLLVLPAALLTFAAMAFQSWRITDCYGLRPWFDFVLSRSGVLAPVFAGIAALCVAAAWRNRSRRAVPALPADRRWTAPAIIVAVGVPLLLFAIAFLRDDLGRVPLLPDAAVRHFILTDVRGLVRLYSLPVMVAALAGWILLAPRRPAGPALFPAWAFLAAMAPGILLTGWMNNYMMETRRMMIVPAPLVSLCLAACLAAAARWCPRPAAGRATASLLCLAAIATLFLSKSILYLTTEYRGFHEFLRPFAAEIRRHNGILLGEYSRVAAPFEHFFGIPVLSLDSDRRADYSRAGKSWQALMRRHPDRTFLFLSPYASPVSAKFDFEPLMEEHYAGERLSSSRQSIPENPRPFRLTLHLFRMSLKSPDRTLTPSAFVRPLDGGNMGLVNFANPVTRPPRVNVIPLPAAHSVQIGFPPLSTAATLLFFAYSGPGTNAAPLSATHPATSRQHPIAWAPLTDGWWVGECAALPADTTTLNLRSAGADTFLGAVLARNGPAITPVGVTASIPPELRVVPLPAIRWARDGATMLIPVPRGESAMAYALVGLATNQPAALTRLESGAAPETGALPHRQALELAPGEWSWRAIPLRGDADNIARLVFRAEPPWNPALKGFPDDLAMMVGVVVSRPPVPAPAAAP